MKHSSRQAARRLGLHLSALQRYIRTGIVTAPPLQANLSGVKFRVWFDEDIKRARRELTAWKKVHRPGRPKKG